MPLDRPFRRRVAAVATMMVVVGAALATAGISGADPVRTGGSTSQRCSPAVTAIGYSDALDKVESADGVTVGGLSALDYDTRAGAYVAPVDNDDDEPARLWFFRDLNAPDLLSEPVLLRDADGVSYTGETADLEGLAVLPNGNYLVSSETEPSIRIFSRDGVQQQELPVPERFAVAPAGQASDNATLEGLTVSPDGRRIVAAMEGSLSGDTAGEDHRLLVYRRQHGEYALIKQIGYRTDDGLRISEATFYARNKLLIMEASWNPLTGNRVILYAADLTGATDVSSVDDLAGAPGAMLDKALVADVTGCPDLGAPARQPQTNPLMDNYEAMDVSRSGSDAYAVTLLSDDNFNPTQITRVLRLSAELP